MHDEILGCVVSEHHHHGSKGRFHCKKCEDPEYIVRYGEDHNSNQHKVKGRVISLLVSLQRNHALSRKGSQIGHNNYFARKYIPENVISKEQFTKDNNICNFSNKSKQRLEFPYIFTYPKCSDIMQVTNHKEYSPYKKILHAFYHKGDVSDQRKGKSVLDERGYSLICGFICLMNVQIRMMGMGFISFRQQFYKSSPIGSIAANTMMQMFNKRNFEDCV